MEVTYSSAGTEVLPELSRRLNIVLLKHLGGQRFEVLLRPPDWFNLVFGQVTKGNVVDLRSASLFLDSFQTDAEEHWVNRRPEPLKSGVWHEFDDQDVEHYLEATALFVNDLPLLSIESLGHDYEVRVQLFQKARNYVLQHQDLNFETQKNDILLHLLADNLGPHLHRLQGMFKDLEVAGLSDPSRTLVTKSAADCEHQRSHLTACLAGFTAELAAMEHLSRDPATAPDLNEAARALVKSELDHFLSRSVGLSMSSNVRPGQSLCVGHRPRLDKLLSGLIHFALRRAPQGTSINLQVSEADEAFLLVEMWESEASLQHDETDLFDHLLSNQALVRKSALALYFCKITVERWGGSIGYRRQGERGCWWLKLPRVEGAVG